MANFGVLKCDFIAVEATGMDANSRQTLKSGTLIQIIPDYCNTDKYLFKIIHLTNWLDKFKTTMYKCAKDDFIVVANEILDYLLAVTNDEERIKLVQNVNNKKFDLEMIELGSKIQISGPPGSMEKYYQFDVIYNGALKEIGPGFYIGLQLKNDYVPLTADLKRLSQHYCFGGIGIIVTLDWIMLNLYKEDDQSTVSQAKQNRFEHFRGPSENETSESEIFKNETSESETSESDTSESEISENEISEFLLEITSNYAAEDIPITNADEAVRNPEKTKCDYCFTTVEIGHVIILRECSHSFCKDCLCVHVESNLIYSEIRCPYKKDYECGFNLQDADIIELGAETLFNQFRDNKVMNHVANNLNARKCSNEACGNVWVSLLGTDDSMERCSKCGAYLYLICNSGHAPGERHRSNPGKSTKVNEMKKIFEPELTKINASCVKCRKPNSTYTLCKDCVKPKFKTPQTSIINNMLITSLSCPEGFAEHDDKNYVVPTSLINEKTEQPDQTPQFSREPAFNYTAVETEFNNNDEYSVVQTPSINEQPEETFEIDVISGQRDQITTNFATEIEFSSNAATIKCNECSKTVEISQGTILRKCLHSFCRECIRALIHYNSIYLEIRCPYKNGYECKFDLLDVEIKDLGGEQVYNKIVENRRLKYINAKNIFY